MFNAADQCISHKILLFSAMAEVDSQSCQTSVILATAPVQNSFVNSEPLGALWRLSETKHISMPFNAFVSEILRVVWSIAARAHSAAKSGPIKNIKINLL